MPCQIHAVLKWLLAYKGMEKNVPYKLPAYTQMLLFPRLACTWHLRPWKAKLLPQRPPVSVSKSWKQKLLCCANCPFDSSPRFQVLASPYLPLLLPEMRECVGLWREKDNRGEDRGKTMVCRGTWKSSKGQPAGARRVRAAYKLNMSRGYCAHCLLSTTPLWKGKHKTKQ